MQKIIFSALSVLIISVVFSQPKVQLNDKFVLVIHGGAGTILKSQMTPEKEMAYKMALQQALRKGYDTLAHGGSALDAVEMSVRFMEDFPLFNAGKCAVFTNEEKNQLDAAIMNGKTLGAGSVASVTTIRNPVTAARAVMEKSNHVMLVSKGAEEFAASQGLEIVDPSYFFTERAWQNLLKAKEADSLKINSEKKKGSNALAVPVNYDQKYGTVGAVALDRYGNLAAATSTGASAIKNMAG